MHEKILLPLMVLSLLLGACATPSATAPIVVTENPTSPGTPIAYPPPAASSPLATPGMYPAPATLVATPPISPTPATAGDGTATIPPSGYEPQAGDNHLRRDPIFLNLASSRILVTPSAPVDVKVIINGNLPDPKHQLRLVVTPADAQNIIHIEAYSLVPPGLVTIQALTPFMAVIPLGTYTGGDYAVMVNGEKLGQFAGDYAPQPGDKALTRGEAGVDMAASELVIVDPQLNEPSVILRGNLPDPCHRLRIVLTPADTQNKINLLVYSVNDPQLMCIMMIQPFQIAIDLGKNPSGRYSVYVNGQLLGEFVK